MNRAAWKIVRARALKSSGGLCALRCRSGSAILDVVTLDPEGDPSSGYVVLCRSCRIRRSWPRMAKKILATRRARAAQMRLPKVSKVRAA